MYKLNEIVFVNTGGNTSSGHITNKQFIKQNNDGNLIYRLALHGHYWKDQDCYLVKFENGTQQYIPAKYISNNILDFMNCPECKSNKIIFSCEHCGNNFNLSK